MQKNRQESCVYCGSELDLTIDHVVPLSQWRKFHVRRRVLDNDSNRVTACRRCNQEKGHLGPKEWIELHPEYRRRFLSQARYLSDAVKEIAGLTRRETGATGAEKRRTRPAPTKPSGQASPHKADPPRPAVPGPTLDGLKGVILPKVDMERSVKMSPRAPAPSPPPAPAPVSYSVCGTYRPSDVAHVKFIHLGSWPIAKGVTAEFFVTMVETFERKRKSPSDALLCLQLTPGKRGQPFTVEIPRCEKRGTEP